MILSPLTIEKRPVGRRTTLMISVYEAVVWFAKPAAELLGLPKNKVSFELGDSVYVVYHDLNGYDITVNKKRMSHTIHNRALCKTFLEAFGAKNRVTFIVDKNPLKAGIYQITVKDKA